MSTNPSTQGALFANFDSRRRPFVLRIQLDDEMKEYLDKEVVGSGGFQTLIRSLQSCTRNGVLELGKNQIEKIAKYRKYCKGTGGFQGRLKQVYDTLKFVRDILNESEL